MLRTFGVENVFILDGGLPAWLEAGLPTSAEAVARPPATFHATFDASAAKDYAQIRELIASDGLRDAQIVDARSAGRFDGTTPEPRPGLSSGHMPGSINIPYTELVSAGRLKDPDALRQLFAEKHVDLTQPITTTCGSGVTAAVLKLGLELAGAQQVTLYDGSWAEYAQQPDAIIEKA